MSLVQDRNNILEVLRSRPASVRRLWVERGHEMASDQCIKEARAQGISFRILPREAFTRRFRGIQVHTCLETDEIAYTEPHELLRTLRTITNPLLCAFDGIYDPQNLGNIIRSAACLEVDAVILPKDRSCTVTGTVAGIAKGGIEHVKMVRVVNIPRHLEEMKKEGIFCFGLDEKGGHPLWRVDLKGPVCLVFGKEDGLRRLTRRVCDEILMIPTCAAFPSLNVATSFAVALYEVKRQRAAISR